MYKVHISKYFSVSISEKIRPAMSEFDLVHYCGRFPYFGLIINPPRPSADPEFDPVTPYSVWHQFRLNCSGIKGKVFKFFLFFIYPGYIHG